MSAAVAAPGKRKRGRPRTSPRPSTVPPKPATAPPPGGDLRREVEILAPSETPSVAPGGCIDPPPTSAPPAALDPLAQWRAFGPSIAQMMLPIYRKVGATMPALVVWEGFAENWGRVALLYFPEGAQHPLAGALVSSVMVFGPLAMAVQAERERAAAVQKQRQQEQQQRPDATRVVDEAPTGGNGFEVDRSVFLGGGGRS